MRQVKTSESMPTTVRSGRSSLNPFVLDDITPMLAEIRPARSDRLNDVHSHVGDHHRGTGRPVARCY